VMCVISEVAYTPVRQESNGEKQKLIGDVANLLSNHGFILVRAVPHMPEFSLYRGPVGLRGRGFQGFADAIFLKEIDVVEATYDGADLATKLRKLAMAALVFGQLEYALECLRRARRAGLPVLADTPAYWTFLDALEAEAAKVKPRYYPTYADFHPLPATATATSAQPVVPEAPAGIFRWKHVARMLLSRSPTGLANARELARRIRMISAHWRQVFQEHFARRTSIERFLAANGFGPLSEDVRLLRLKQEQWCRNS
jgi:hypothetical protein